MLFGILTDSLKKPPVIGKNQEFRVVEKKDKKLVIGSRNQ